MTTASDITFHLAEHNCQDPECSNPFDVILFRVGDSQANWLCWQHGIPFMMAVCQAVVEDSAKQSDGQAEEAVAETASPGV